MGQQLTFVYRNPQKMSFSFLLQGTFKTCLPHHTKRRAKKESYNDDILMLLFNQGAFIAKRRKT
jgi:hypothetical protein